MTAQASNPHPGLIEQVLNTYAHNTADHQPLLAFLTKHPATVEALSEARPHLERIFAPKRMALEIVVEPDDEETWEVVFGIVEGDWDPKTAMRLMKQFDHEWWLEQMVARDLLGRLNFTVGFTEHAAV